MSELVREQSAQPAPAEVAEERAVTVNPRVDVPRTGAGTAGCPGPLRSAPRDG